MKKLIELIIVIVTIFSFGALFYKHIYHPFLLKHEGKPEKPKIHFLFFVNSEGEYFDPGCYTSDSIFVQKVFEVYPNNDQLRIGKGWYEDHTLNKTRKCKTIRRKKTLVYEKFE